MRWVSKNRRRDKKAFLSDQCREINNRIGLINSFKSRKRLRNRSIRRRQEVPSPQAVRSPQTSIGIIYYSCHCHALERCYCCAVLVTLQCGLFSQAFLFLHEYPWDISAVPHGTLCSPLTLVFDITGNNLSIILISHVFRHDFTLQETQGNSRRLHGEEPRCLRLHSWFYIRITWGAFKTSKAQATP